MEKKEISLEEGFNFIIKHGAANLHVRLFNTLLRIGVCDILEDGKPRTSQELAKMVNIPEKGVHKLLRYFTYHKFFNENKSNGCFEKTKYSSLLIKNSLYFDLASLVSGDMYYDLFKSLGDSFIGEESGIPNSLNVNHCWDILGSEENKLLFKGVMISITEIFIKDILDNVDFSNHKIICDIGGNHGQLVEIIVEKYTTIEKGINFDLKSIIDTNTKFKNPKLSHEAGSFFESVPQADAYILKQIIHDWSDQESEKILKTISKSILPGGKLYIFDYVIDEENYDPTLLYYDCKMYHFFHAEERTKNEFKKLLDNSGFKVDYFLKRGLVASKK